MPNLFVGINIDRDRYDACMAELRKVGVRYDDAGIKRAKARIATIYPELDGHLFVVGLRLALLEWRTPAEQQKQREHEGELIIRKRERGAQQRATRAELREVNRRYSAEHKVPIEDVAGHRLERVIRDIESTVDKARRYDRLEKMMGELIIGNTAFGDCTREQLEAAANRLSSDGEKMIARGELYRELADRMVAGETVRAASRIHNWLSAALIAIDGDTEATEEAA